MPTVQRTTVIANRRPTSTEVMSKAGVALDQTWGDENIMSGVAGALTSPRAPARLLTAARGRAALAEADARLQTEREVVASVARYGIVASA